MTNDEKEDCQFHVLTRYKPSQIDSEVGGLAIELENGAALIEVAKVFIMCLDSDLKQID